MPNVTGEIKKDARKAEKKIDHATNEIADKTKSAAKQVKVKAEDLGHRIKKRID